MTDERARAPRETADDRPETERRRRQPDASAANPDPTNRRYGIPDDFMDHEKYTYRSAVDDRTRLYDLTVKDDYDFVSANGQRVTSKDGTGPEDALRYRSGTVDGQPQYTYLLRKPKKFADEDRAKKIAKIDAEEQARLRRVPSDAPDHSYTPGKG